MNDLLFIIYLPFESMYYILIYLLSNNQFFINSRFNTPFSLLLFYLVKYMVINNNSCNSTIIIIFFWISRLYLTLKLVCVWALLALDFQEER